MSQNRNTNVTQTFIVESNGDNIPVFSACTGIYTNNILSCSGNTQIFMGVDIITFSGNMQTDYNLIANGISSNNISACTSVNTNSIVSCSGDSIINLASGYTQFNTDIEPEIDANIDIGTPIKRFRDINTISGTSSVWTSTIKINTPTLDLGLDSQNNLRQITADNSIVQDDFLNGGTF